jgi:hypothetical protein
MIAPELLYDFPAETCLYDEGQRAVRAQSLLWIAVRWPKLTD